MSAKQPDSFDEKNLLAAEIIVGDVERFDTLQVGWALAHLALLQHDALAPLEAVETA